MSKGDWKGKPVSGEDILKELGDPAEWGKQHRQIEFEMRLRFGRKELDIVGIKGMPGSDGYLDFLNKELKHPIGSETGLVSAGKNFHIEEQEKEAIKDEIKKYSELLDGLEKSRSAVVEYLDELKKRLNNLRNSSLYADLPLDNFGDTEEGHNLVMEHNRERRENIKKLKEEIKKYSSLLKKLK